VAFGGDEAGVAQLGEVEAQRRGRQAELVGDGARRHALRPRLDQQAERGEPVFLGERGERTDDERGLHRFHLYFDFSRNMTNGTDAVNAVRCTRRGSQSLR